jgi:DNA repair exonuclease SbcCD ATPase subunit
MSFTSFCNSVAFGVREDVKSFFVASDADRKKVLERILGLTLFTDAEQVARRRVKKVIEEHGAAKSEMEKLQAIVSERKAVLFDLTHSEEMEEIDLHLSIRKLTAKRLRQKHDRLEGELAELRDVEAHEEAAWEEQQAEYKLALTKYEEAKTKLQKGLRQVERAIAGQQGLRKAETQKAIKFEKLAGKKCPTCTQAVGAKLTKKIDAEAKAALTEIDGVLEELAVTEAELTAQIKALEPPEYVVPPASLSEAVQAVKSKEAEWNATGKLRAAEEARVEEMEASRAMVEGKAAALQTQIAQAQQVIETREEEVEEAEAQMQALEFWVQGFGNQGLKSFMIEAELPEINKRATYYAQRLLGSGARVRLSATSKLKTKDLTKEQLSVEGSIPGLTNSYAGASKGQRKRMDLSLLLAFRETVAKRDAKAFQQLFADEIFDGLDKTGAECVVALLKETASECPVMLVTHDSRIKPVADRLVTVVHDGSRAKIQI